MSNKSINEERCAKYSPHFTSDELACKCGGAYCDGHPDTIDGGLLQNLERVREHYGNQPIIITSGLRCERRNKEVGGIPSSKHCMGLAVDFHITGGSCDLADSRNEVMNYIKTLPNHNYTYGNTSQMGNAIHMDVKDSVEGTPTNNDWVARLQAECNAQGYSNQRVDGIAGPITLAGCPTLMTGNQGTITQLLQEKLTALGYPLPTYGCDGDFGYETVEAVQQFQRDFGLVDDGVVGVMTWSQVLGI